MTKWTHSIHHRPTHASARTHRIFAYRQAAAAETARRPAADRVAAAGARRVGHGAADGAHGDLATARTAHAARSPELELARIRHARRLLAPQAHDGGPQDQPDRHA